MVLRQLLRKRPHFFVKPPFRIPRRWSSNPRSPDKTRARIDKLLSRLPRFLRPYTDGLRNAPISHIASFLILHEITAIVPIVGFAGLFHYTNILERTGGDWIGGRWVNEGTQRFGRYFGGKGWFGFSRPSSPHPISPLEHPIPDATVATPRSQGKEVPEKAESVEDRVEEVEKEYGVGERGGRILVEVATAYALTKVLLPVRILGSVWATPWFARVVLGGLGRVGRGVRGR